MERHRVLQAELEETRRALLREGMEVNRLRGLIEELFLKSLPIAAKEKLLSEFSKKAAANEDR